MRIQKVISNAYTAAGKIIRGQGLETCSSRAEELKEN